ncbi:MAG: succinyldiaminopimelate transaminase [Gammaproteobacteria bacterium]|nr:MAG: succinyldiaminopimelate transaminase [Gammaproteobacteria bacterium]
MHNRLDLLQPYPFQRLAALFKGIEPPDSQEPIALSIGEPKHASPDFVLKVLTENLGALSKYPLTRGMDTLRESIASWLQRRFQLNPANMTPEKHILPVNGTREALFAFAQCIVDSSTQAVVLMPNPFYQIYEGAALLAGADAIYINTTVDHNFLPDLDAIPEAVWQRCQLFYACSPGNPTGAVFPQDLWKQLIEYADRYDFVIAADECYSEIYADEDNPPVGLLQVCAETGRDDFSRCVVFHSLSKRSNLPGLRSGFVAGDAAILEKFLLYRTYHGCAMSVPTQYASIAAWNDEEHVVSNRQQYRDKYAAVVPILSPWLEFNKPEASFYLWPQVTVSDEVFSKGLYQHEHVTVLPGSYLSRDTDHGNPGNNRVRMALVAEASQCVEAAHRIAHYCEHLKQ